MSVPRDHQTDAQKGHQGRSGWMMIACCVPMLAIAVVLVVTGVLSPGFLLVAVACVVMMAVMMRGTGHGDGQGGGDSDRGGRDG